MNDAQKLIDDGDYLNALKLLNDRLDDDPDDLTSLFQIGEVFLLSNKLGLAFNVFLALSKKAPNRPEVWNNLGRCLQKRDKSKEARNYFQKALNIDPNFPSALINLAVIDVNEGNPKRAVKLAQKALNFDRYSRQARDVIAMGKLQLRDWSGFEDFLESEGPPFRPLRQYSVPPEKEWMGEHGETVVVYREQGLGDEILFASCVDEAIGISRKVILDVDKRLVGLFKRSFPKADVYGTGYAKELDWPKDYNITSSAPMGRLPYFFRKRDEDFIGKVYLKACPLRTTAYKALLDSLGSGLKIGIAWTGGKRVDQVTKDDAEYRSIDLEDLKPLIHPDHHYISLEYRETETFGLVHDFPFITRTQDYDDTAALVNALDFVIAIPTTVVHLAGALGKPCYCLVPEFSNWRFGLEGEMIWHKSVKLFRGDNNINQLERYLYESGCYRSSRTGT